MVNGDEVNCTAHDSSAAAHGPAHSAGRQAGRPPDPSQRKDARAVRSGESLRAPLPCPSTLWQAAATCRARPRACGRTQRLPALPAAGGRQLERACAAAAAGAATCAHARFPLRRRAALTQTHLARAQALQRRSGRTPPCRTRSSIWGRARSRWRQRTTSSSIRVRHEGSAGLIGAVEQRQRYSLVTVRGSLSSVVPAAALP